ncbi:MAG: enoyl-CoA hydratase-related protein [Sphingobium sp.]
MIDIGTLERRSTTAIVTIDSPSVNALGSVVRAKLIALLAQTVADPSVSVVTCRGRTFFAGADITEIAGPARLSSFPELLDLIEGQGKPVIAAIHGEEVHPWSA